MADGGVYATAGDTVFALDAGDGRERWRFQGDQRWGYDPVVRGGTVYVTREQGVICPLSAADGTELWRYATESHYSIPLAASEDTVYADVFLFDDEGSLLTALDADEGTERWLFGHDGLANCPVVAVGTVYTRDYGLVALRSDDGTERWTTPVPGGAMSPPVVAGDTVYARSSETIHAIDAADGTERGSVDASRTPGQTPAVVATDDLLYFVTPSVRALAVETGRERWSYDFEDDTANRPNVSRPPVAVGPGTLYVGTEKGVYALAEPR